tara:strand:- start:210 stop:395 length:186 start_codon:yes stop_codon:yes gene_type:complete
MKKKDLESALVEIFDLVKWNFEGDEKNDVVVRDMKNILKKYNIKKDVYKLYKEFLKYERTI